MSIIKFGAIIILIAGLVLVAGCTEGNVTRNVGGDHVTQGSTCDITDHNNGVLTFNCPQPGFADHLSEYRKTHPDVRVVSVVPPYYGDFQFNGYLVITEPIAPESGTCPAP
jgi:hypothetical protein